ncbi:MAG: hypothetical protein AB7G37_14775, partial [Solirubrobacteraceae bacterium]
MVLPHRTRLGVVDRAPVLVTGVGATLGVTVALVAAAAVPAPAIAGSSAPAPPAASAASADPASADPARAVSAAASRTTARPADVAAPWSPVVADDARHAMHPKRLAKMTLLGRTPTGIQPDGVASDPVISHDSRANRYVAYTSTGTNIATPVERGRRNVYLVQRTGKVTMNANAWEVGPTRLLSVGMGGVPADGDSWGAALSGYTDRGDRPGHAR